MKVNVFTRKIFLVFILFSILSFLSYANSIDVWLTHSNEEMKIVRELAEDFTKKTGVKVNFTYVNSADSETVFLMAAASNTAYDVGLVGSLFAPELGLRGAVIDLTRFSDFSNVSTSFSPKYFNSLQYKGLTFGIPYRSYLYLGYQRTDILRDMGMEIVRTWDDLKKALPRLQAKNMNAALTFGLSESVYADVNMFMWQHGGEDYNYDLTKSGYDLPETIAGFKEFAELYTKYNIPKEIVPFQAFTTGEIPIMIQSGHFYTSLTVSAPQIKGHWQMTPALGTVKDSQLNIDTFIGGQALIISKDSKNPEAAWEFVKWISSKEIQSLMSMRFASQISGAMFIPGNPDAIVAMPIASQDAKTLKFQAEGSRSSTYGLVAPRLRRRYLQFAAQEVVLMGKDPEEAIRKAAAEHNEEIRKKTKEYERFIKRLLEDAKN